MSLDFLVIGAPKSGTTTLFEYLREHPRIELPPDKEAPYFSDDRIVGRLSWEEYLRRTFPAGGGGRLRGTITPHYMSPITGVAGGPGGNAPAYDEHTLPRRIHERLPSARLIAILRDPVERAYSHHVQETRLGHETRPFPVAVDELLRPETLADSRRQSTRTNCYVALGEYGRLLGAYYDLFPAERILVLLTEELAREPRAVLERIYEFLEIDAVEPRNLGRRDNVSAAELKVSRVSPASAVRLASANPVTRAIWHSLSARRRSALLAWYKRLDFRFKSWNRRPAPAKEPPAADVAALDRLREHYAPDALLLAELLGRPVPWAPGEAADSPEAVRK